MAKRITMADLKSAEADSIEKLRKMLIGYGIPKELIIDDQNSTDIVLYNNRGHNLAYQTEGKWRFTSLIEDYLVQVRQESADAKKEGRFNDYVDGLKKETKFHPIYHYCQKSSTTVYLGSGRTYEEANHALREAARADNITIRNNQIVYRCAITGDSRIEGEEGYPYRKAFSSLLSKAGINQKELEASRLEVIATGPHTQETRKINPSGAAPPTLETLTITDLF